MRECGSRNGWLAPDDVILKEFVAEGTIMKQLIPIPEPSGRNDA